MDLRQHAVLLPKQAGRCIHALVVGALFLLAQHPALAAHEAVLPLLETHCVKCHGGDKTKAGFDLTTREGLLQGGESGPAIVPGQPKASLLYQLVAHAKDPAMPHKQAKLPAVALEQIADWIKGGAPYDRALRKTVAGAAPQTSGEFSISEADRKHWAFQPLRRPELPVARNKSWPRQPVDAFILAGLEAKNLIPAPPATREQLIRRVTFDLIGLPPTPGEIDAFVKDASPNAYEKLVDRLLASPHYGERWGRHWLDLARFAESDGFEHDAVRPHSFRYRDYVIKSFNADKPYDRFLKEQLAGDELYPDDTDARVATAFNLLGPDMVDSADQVQRRHNTLNDMTDTAGLAFLGMTVGCARCHDHKFEPISQRDYYRLQAFFTPVAFQREWPVPTPQEQAAFDVAIKEHTARTKSRQKELSDLESPYRQKLHDEKLAKLSEEAQLAHKTPKAQRTTEQKNQIQETASLLEIGDKELAGVMSEADKPRHRTLKEALKKIPPPAPLPMTMALQNTNGPPAKTFVLVRGEPNNPDAEVQPGFPSVLSQDDRPRAESRRGALASWIANPENPLTARVMVNRIWQHHFGRGIVPTPSDFGVRGQRPTHPELLDWLAGEFIGGGWKIKPMHKLILLSATYRQSSQASSETLARDPENLLFSRRDRVRLEGEVIRDSLLAISGRLHPDIGGPSVQPPIPADIMKGSKGWTVSASLRDHQRRSVYIFARRNVRFPFLEVFDAPDNNLSCAARERSTSAPQSLTLLNADEVLAATKATTERVMLAATSTGEQIVALYRMALGRGPSDKELALSHDFMAQSPLSELCRALFNLNAFVYVD